MKVSSLPALGWVMLLAIQGLSQAAPKFRITGVVVNQSNGAPIPHCHLSPSRAGHARAVEWPADRFPEQSPFIYTRPPIRNSPEHTTTAVVTVATFFTQPKHAQTLLLRNSVS